MTTVTASFRSEIIKSKNTFALWLVLFGAAFSPALLFLIYLNRPANFIPKPGQNPWDFFMSNGLQFISFFFIPFFIVLLCGLVVSIEHKSNTWKHLFTLPVSKSTVYVNKLLIILSLAVICYGLFFVLLLVSGGLIGLVKPELKFMSHTPDFGLITKLLFRSFISTLGILAIHYWLSIRLKNMILPIGIGLVCIVTGTILFGRWDNLIYYPHAYTIFTIFPQPGHTSFLQKHEIYSLLYFAGVTLLGYVDFTRFYKG